MLWSSARQIQNFEDMAAFRAAFFAFGGLKQDPRTFPYPYRSITGNVLIRLAPHAGFSHKQGLPYTFEYLRPSNGQASVHSPAPARTCLTRWRRKDRPS